MRLARCSPNTIPLFPKLPAAFPSPLQLGSGLMKLWPKKCKWKLMYTTFRGGLSKAILQDPAHSLSLPYRYVNDGSITDERGMRIAMWNKLSLPIFLIAWHRIFEVTCRLFRHSGFVSMFLHIIELLPLFLHFISCKLKVWSIAWLDSGWLSW